jgi:hypothetical protein
MKTRLLLATPLLLAPALVAFQPRGTQITFAVAEGATKTKTFTNSVSMTLDDMSMLLNGQESPMMPQINMSVDSELEITVTDEYLAMGDGAPKKLQRTYDAISMNNSMEMEMDIMGQVQNQNDSGAAESELEGETVVFTAGDSGYVASFPGDEGDEKLLVDLTEDLDFRGLLPEGEVEEGAEWKVSPAVLRDIMVPGGDLKLESDGGESDPMGMGSDSGVGEFQDWFSEDVEGEIVATFRGMKETDEGLKVAVIELTIELANAVDLTEKVREGMADAEMPDEVGEMEINGMDIEVEIEGTATLLWNPAAGCAHSFEMEGELVLITDTAMAISAQGMDMEIEQTMEFSGTMNVTATIE